MNKELYAGQTIAKEVTFLDGEGAQPFRTTHTKRRKKQKRKKKKTSLVPSLEGTQSRSVCYFSGCARALVCGCAEVRCAPIGAARSERICFYKKVPFFLSTPGVRALRSRVFKITPLPQPNQVTWVWLTSLHHLQVSPLLSRCFGYVRRLRTELPGHDGQTLWCEPEQVQSL